MTRERLYYLGGAALAVFVGTAVVLRSSQPLTPQLDASFVAARWATALRQYNITPVFPPHYMQVGDVYLFLAQSGENQVPDANAFHRFGLWLGRADVRQQLQNEAASESVLPPSVGESASDHSTQTLSAMPLRPTAYPGFNLAQISDSDLHAGLLARLFQGWFGATGRGELIMSISIPVAEDQELSATDAELAFEDFCRIRNGHSPCYFDDPQFRRFVGTLRQPGDPENMVPTVVFVSHVFYAQQISYYFSASNGAAFALGAGLVSAVQNGKSARVSRVASATGAAGDLAEDRSAHVQADIQVSPAGAGVLPSGSISAVRAADGSITLNQTFTTPVAIGFRGLEYPPFGYPQSSRKVSDERR